MKRKLEEREGSDPTFDSNKRPRVLDSLGTLSLSILLQTMLLMRNQSPGQGLRQNQPQKLPKRNDPKNDSSRTRWFRRHI